MFKKKKKTIFSFLQNTHARKILNKMFRSETGIEPAPDQTRVMVTPALQNN